MRLCRNTTQSGHDTAARPVTLRAATRRWAPTTRPTGACDTAPCGHDTDMRVRAWARLCSLGCAGWVRRLCTWCTQPVFGLSTVSESLI